MNILAFDTSTNTCSVALWQDGKIIAQQFEPMARGQSEALVPMIGAILDQVDLTPIEMDLIAVTTGPGAFTGVRIGLATARSLAQAAKVPLIGISTFDALVFGLKDKHPSKNFGMQQIFAVIDTKRDDVFVQAYDAELQPFGDARVISCDAMCQEIKSASHNNPTLLDNPTLLVGSGAPMIAVSCQTSGHSGLVEVYDDQPQAKSVAEIAALRGVPAKDAVPPAPVYLRAPEARINPTGGRLRT